MSRSDLDRIQTRLKVAIQNHQMLVTKMKSDPQSSSVQEQLHEIQSQITTLSEKQKMIVQLLRKELVPKPGSDTPSPTISPGPPATIPVYSKGVALQMMPISMPTYTLQPSRPLVMLAPKPATNPPILDTTSTRRPSNQQPVVAMTLPQNNTDLTNSSPPCNNVYDNNNKTVRSENILGISQKTNTTAPLRVPQIPGHRPSILQGTARHTTGKVTNSPLVPVCARRGSDTDLSNYKKLSISSDATTEERKKLEFMASLDLITQETLKDLQARRSERKRRSTANPQFSYGHFEPERKREAVTYLTRVPIEPSSRRRGRPPKIRSPLKVPTTKSSHQVVYQLCPVFVCPKPLQASHICKNEEQLDNEVHEDFCAVCRRSGELLMCDTCNLVYHLGCLDPPLSTIPQGLWSCAKCQSLNKQGGSNWPGTLALVHSYITHKAAKEEEKKNLTSKIKSLQSEKQGLDTSATKLTENIAQHLEKKAELQNSYRTAQQSVEKLKNLIRVFQTS